MKVRRYVPLLAAVLASLSLVPAHAGTLTNSHTTSPWCLFSGQYYGQVTAYYNWVYTDTYGAHAFNGTSYVYVGAPAYCNDSKTSFTANSTDGLGYVLNATGGGGTVTVPTATSGYVNPKYVIVGITYAPPGPSSFVNYTNSKLVGNTASLSSSFSSQVTRSVKVTKSLGIQGWVGGSVSASSSTSNTQESDSSSSVTISKQTTSSDQTPGPANPYVGINHNYDVIWLWLNPLALFTTFKTSTTNAIQWNGYGYSTLDQPAMDIYPVLVGWMNGDLVMTSAQAGPLNRTWAAVEIWPSGQGPGLTAADRQNIAKADPYWQCTKTPSACPTAVDPTRYTLTFNQDFVYLQAAPGGQPGTQTYSATYTDTTTQNHGAKYTTAQTFGYERAFSGGPFLASFQFDLMVQATLMWTHGWNSQISSTNTSSALLSITGPPCVVSAGHCNPVYSKSTQFDLYQDVLYGTFLLNPVN